jgi:hypothetical protein
VLATQGEDRVPHDHVVAVVRVGERLALDAVLQAPTHSYHLLHIIGIGIGIGIGIAKGRQISVNPGVPIMTILTRRWAVRSTYP